MNPIIVNPHPIAVPDAWRSVRDELPKALVDVQVVVWMEEEPSVHQAFRDDSGTWRLTGLDHLKVAVSHWMPCVALPDVLAACFSDMARHEQQRPVV